MSVPGHVVILGAGHAGMQAAIALRQAKFAGAITLLDADSEWPYHRPPLSKSYILEGETPSIRQRPAAFYEDKQLDLRRGVSVTAIDRQSCIVHSDDGAALNYGHLILATGAANRALPIPGAQGAQVHGLRSLADASRLRDALKSMPRVAIIGGGFIGLETATMATKLGCPVSVIEAAPRLMARVVSPVISAHFKRLHEDVGVTFHLDAKAARIEEGVVLDDGQIIAADQILIAAGVVPNQGLAEQAGLATDNGIVVDERLLTSDPHISAIGDCAQFYERYSQSHVRLESIQNAGDQAKYLAKRLVDPAQATASYAAVPWFWSDQQGEKLQIAGMTAAADETRVASEDPMVVHCFKANNYIGTESVGSPKVHMQARKLLARQATISVSMFKNCQDDLSMIGNHLEPYAV